MSTTVGASLYHGPSSQVLIVPSPRAGTYELTVASRGSPTEVLTTASAMLPSVLYATLAWLAPQDEVAMEATILAGYMSPQPTPGPGGPGFDRGARFVATVVGPAGQTRDVVLRDDGRSRDGDAGDGLWAAPIRFVDGGGYTVQVTARLQGSLELQRSLGFFHARAKDTDLDGLLDDWEQRHFPGLSLARVNPLSDIDADGLSAYEEHRFGTDPRHHDTDRDGRADGDEVDAGTDATAPDDSLITQQDSDGDGLPDAWERLYFRDATIEDVQADADPDDDGLSNFAEWRIDTHPRRADSDGDGISDGVSHEWQTPGPITRGARHPAADAAPIDEAALFFWLLMLLTALIIWFAIWWAKS